MDIQELQQKLQLATAQLNSHAIWNEKKYWRKRGLVVLAAHTSRLELLGALPDQLLDLLRLDVGPHGVVLPALGRGLFEIVLVPILGPFPALAASKPREEARHCESGCRDGNRARVGRETRGIETSRRSNALAAGDGTPRERTAMGTGLGRLGGR